VAVANAVEIVQGVRAAHRGGGVHGILRGRRRYGGLIVHVGLALAAVAITASSTMARQAEVTLAQGKSTTFAGFDLRYQGMRTLRQPQRTVLVTDLAVSRRGDLGRMSPSLNLYPAASEPIGTPSIRYGTLRDLYASVIGVDGAGEQATFRFFLNPGVTWLWIGGAVMALGGLLAVWPSRRRGQPEPERPKARKAPRERELTRTGGR
jgi:cytochrome c-type biogenesis protein CcmF